MNCSNFGFTIPPRQLSKCGGNSSKLCGMNERVFACAQGRCATRLRYAPTLIAFSILNYLSEGHHRMRLNFCHRRRFNFATPRTGVSAPHRLRRKRNRQPKLPVNNLPRPSVANAGRSSQEFPSSGLAGASRLDDRHRRSCYLCRSCRSTKCAASLAYWHPSHPRPCADFPAQPSATSRRRIRKS